jgi:hypothetical protein
MDNLLKDHRYTTGTPGTALLQLTDKLTSWAGRGGGDRTKSAVETSQVVDSSNGQNYINLQIRPSGVHAGYAEPSEVRLPRTHFLDGFLGLPTIRKLFRVSTWNKTSSATTSAHSAFFAQVGCTNLLRVHVQAVVTGLKTRMGCAGSSGGLLLISKKYGQCGLAAWVCRFRAVRRGAPVTVSGVTGGECSSFTATR